MNSSQKLWALAYAAFIFIIIMGVVITNDEMNRPINSTEVINTKSETELLQDVIKLTKENNKLLKEQNEILRRLDSNKIQ